MAKTNEQFALAAKYIFKFKYSKHSIVIRDTFKYPREKWPIEQLYVGGLKIETKSISNVLKFFGLKKTKPQPPTHLENEHSITIMNYRMIIDTFKHFDVSNLKLFYINPEHYQAEFLGEIISNYSSKSMTAVQFYDCSVNTLEFIRKPLINVKSVRFAGRFLGLNYNVLAINELFPVVEELFLVIDAHNLDYFSAHMPKLKHLYLKGEPFIDTLHPKSHYENILRKNQQIQSIEVFSAASKCLRAINSFSPNLTRLTLFDFDLEDEAFCFANVSTFIVKSSEFLPKKLHFPKLKAFHLELQERYDLDVWVDFMKKHDQMSEFHLICDDFDAVVFETLIAELPNLLEMTFRYTGQRELIDTVGLKELLRNHEHLQRFYFTFDHISYEGCREDFNVMRGKWSVNDIRNGFAFERA